jgi:hypothetical protein
MNKNREELFALNASLYTEADKMLKETGLGKIINEAGNKPVGSYMMQTMTWRDLDFERSEDNPDWQRHLELGKRLMQLDWLWEIDDMNTYITRYFPDLPVGFYWGLRGDYPKGGQTWKFDLWTAREEEFERGLPRMAMWMSKLTEETRFYILAIKDALYNTLEYRRAIRSIHIYEAVLECNIHTLEEFREWWQARYGK